MTQPRTLEEASVMRVGVSVILLLVLVASNAWAQDGAAAEAALDLTREDRRRIQSSLAAQGFDPGPADGVFGRRTRAAIGRWQGSRGEAPTGFLDAAAARRCWRPHPRRRRRRRHPSPLKTGWV